MVFTACLINSTNFESTFLSHFTLFGCNLKEHIRMKPQWIWNMSRWKVWQRLARCSIGRVFLSCICARCFACLLLYCFMIIYLWLYLWIPHNSFMLELCVMSTGPVGKFATPNSRQVSDPPKFHQSPRLYPNCRFFPLKLGEDPLSTYQNIQKHLFTFHKLCSGTGVTCKCSQMSTWHT